MSIRSSVRLRTNIQCRMMSSMLGLPELHRPPVKVRSHLTYFELRALHDASPFNFSTFWTERDQLTPHQIAHHEAYLRDYREPRWEPAIAGFLRYDARRTARRPDPPLAESAAAAPVIGIEPAPAAKKPTPTGTSEEPATTGADERLGTQADVINAPQTQSLLVLAPPGTGKTHVLIERLAKLLSDGNIERPADELLVLGFARATVAEVRRRLEGRVAAEISDDLRYVSVKTFDSFATRALIDAGALDIESAPVGSDDESSFDPRIEALVGLLERALAVGRVPTEFQRLRYLVVDEIQDLVGPRARLVNTLIETVYANGGTVLAMGDPAQAIYDYDEKTPDSREFLRRLREQILPHGREIHLGTFHRFATSEMKNLVSELYSAVGVDGSAPDGAAMNHIISRSVQRIQFAELPSMVGARSSTAILTRSNAEAHQIASWLRASGIAHNYNRGASGTRWPVGIARLLFRWKLPRMSRREFDLRLAEYETLAGHEEANACVTCLEQMSALDEDSVDVMRVRQAVGTETAPRASVASGTMVVSTIHRAKGLEYDRVLLLEPDMPRGSSAEECRVLYVAATRAKVTFSVLRRDQSILKRTRRIGQTKYLSAGSSIYLNGSADFSRNLMDTTLVRSITLVSLLEELWQQYRVGGAGAEGYLLMRSALRRDYFTLGVRIDGQIQEICRCTDNFSRALWGRRDDVTDLGNGCRGWPVKFTGLEAMAYDVADAVATDTLGSAGLAWIPVLENPINI